VLTKIKLVLSRVLIDDVHRTLSPFSEYSDICLNVFILQLNFHCTWQFVKNININDC